MTVDIGNIRILTGNANPELAKEIADHIGVKLCDAYVGHFNNGETQVMISESVRGKDIFIIQPTSQPVNDSLMREVTSRRYGKADPEELPDLIIIDGGKGQLSSALEIIRGAGHQEVPVVGLAKQFEYIFVEGSSDPVILPRQSQALYLVERIRDEAHRFAITYHRKLRGKRNLVSVLDHIEGIGPKRRKLIWEHFGSLAKIREASVEELASLDGMTFPAAQAVYNFFAAQALLHNKAAEKGV